jgi:membrane protein required for beta-lactamase induction
MMRHDCDAPPPDAHALRLQADAAIAAYERTAWVKYVAVFIPVPFVVLLLRHRLDAWGYGLAGTAFVALAIGVLVLDRAAVNKRDRAVAAAERAEQANKPAAD